LVAIGDPALLAGQGRQARIGGAWIFLASAAAARDQGRVDSM